MKKDSSLSTVRRMGTLLSFPCLCGRWTIPTRYACLLLWIEIGVAEPTVGFVVHNNIWQILRYQQQWQRPWSTYTHSSQRSSSTRRAGQNLWMSKRKKEDETERKDNWQRKWSAKLEWRQRRGWRRTKTGHDIWSPEEQTQRNRTNAGRTWKEQSRQRTAYCIAFCISSNWS